MNTSSLLVATCLAFSTLTWAAPVSLPATKARVVDTTGTLTEEQVAALQRRSAELDERTGAVILAVMIPTTGEEAIDQYSLRLAEAWAPGHKQNERAAILVIAKADKKVRIETSRVIGTKLTDAAASRIIRVMNEQALSSRAGSNFYKGIDLFYSEVEKYIPPKDAPLIVASSSYNTSYVIFFGALLFFTVTFGGWLWINSIRKARLEKERAERLRRTIEHERVALENERLMRVALENERLMRLQREARATATPAPSTTSNSSTILAAIAERKRRERAEEDDRASARRRRKEEDDRASSSTSSSIFDSGSSSSFDSGSSSTAFDGGGSSGSID